MRAQAAFVGCSNGDKSLRGTNRADLELDNKLMNAEIP